jgi:hypothetical protein
MIRSRSRWCSGSAAGGGIAGGAGSRPISHCQNVRLELISSDSWDRSGGEPRQEHTPGPRAEISDRARRKPVALPEPWPGIRRIAVRVQNPPAIEMQVGDEQERRYLRETQNTTVCEPAR